MSKQFTLQLNSPKVASLTLGTPSAQTRLDPSKGITPRAKALVDTTEHWMQKRQYIPARGEIIVYSDRNIIDGTYYAGVKIGDGTTFVVDLPFVGDDIAMQIMDDLTAHINDTSVHVTIEDRESWDNKLNCEIDDETLVLNRL